MMKKSTLVKLKIVVLVTLMELGLGVLMLVASQRSASAEANTVDRYALLPSKVNLQTCQQQALGLHPGVIDKLRVLPQPNTFWIRYEIQMRGGAEWSVVCDLANGKIIREQSLDVAVSQ